MPEVDCGFKDVPGGAPGAHFLISYGPTLGVDIGFDPNFVPGKELPIAGITGIAALVDTGASESCIDSVLATQLNLPIVDKRTTSGAHGSQEVTVHLAQVHVPSLNFTIYGQFCAVHLAAGGQVHKALLGRTFLAAFHLTYDGRSGSVVIKSFDDADAPAPVPAQAP